MRRRRDGAALRADTAPDCASGGTQIIAFDEVEQLRHRVRPVARVQQRIRERVGVRAIARSAQQCDQRVLLRERPEHRDADRRSPARTFRRRASGSSPGACRRPSGHRARTPSTTSRHPASAPSEAPAGPHPGRRDGAARPCRRSDRSCARAPRRSRSASCPVSRFVRLYWRFSRLVCSRLVVLTSMPRTRASGRQTAYLAACHVPHPATRISRSARYGLSGHSRW